MADSQKETTEMGTVMDPKLAQLQSFISMVADLRADILRSSKKEILKEMMEGKGFEEAAKSYIDSLLQFYCHTAKEFGQDRFNVHITQLVTFALTPNMTVHNALKESETKMKEIKQELAKKTKELEILKSSNSSKVVEMKEKLELAEKAKHKKDQDIKHINRLKQEKSKKDAGLAGFDKMKKELVNVKEELKRMKGIADSDRSTIEKLIEENEKLKKQLKNSEDSSTH